MLCDSLGSRHTHERNAEILFDKLSCIFGRQHSRPVPDNNLFLSHPTQNSIVHIGMSFAIKHNPVLVRQVYECHCVFSK